LRPVAFEDPTASSWSTVTAADGTYSVCPPPGTGYTVLPLAALYRGRGIGEIRLR
jgi:hypothetical protein